MNEETKRENLIKILDKLGVTGAENLATERMVKKIVRRIDDAAFLALPTDLQKFATEEIGYAAPEPAVAGTAETETVKVENIAPPAAPAPSQETAPPAKKRGRPRKVVREETPEPETRPEPEKRTKPAKGAKEKKSIFGRREGSAMQAVRDAFKGRKTLERHELIAAMVQTGVSANTASTFVSLAKNAGSQHFDFRLEETKKDGKKILRKVAK